MASLLKQRSSLVSIPTASTEPLLSSIPVPSILNVSSKSSTWLYTTATIVVTLLVLEQAVYRYKKKHLPGSTWTIPLIGKFVDSLYPSVENYCKQWAQGDLSAVSVFNMYMPTFFFGIISG
jgi:C-22 sterol desaturase